MSDLRKVAVGKAYITVLLLATTCMQTRILMKNIPVKESTLNAVIRSVEVADGLLM